MGETVYADILFFINFSMDFLCFYICSRVLGRRLHVLRATVASVIGGAVAMLFFDPGGSAEILLDIGVLLIMCAVAQPNGKNSLAGEFGGAAMYAGISAALGGFMTAVYSLANRLGLSGDAAAPGSGDVGGEMSAWVFALLAASGAAAAVIGGRRLRLRSSGDRFSVTVSMGGKNASFDGMTDSGNLLSDPLSGRRVMICELSAVDGLLDRNDTLGRAGCHRHSSVARGGGKAAVHSRVGRARRRSFVRLDAGESYSYRRQGRKEPRRRSARCSRAAPTVGKRLPCAPSAGTYGLAPPKNQKRGHRI